MQNQQEAREEEPGNTKRCFHGAFVVFVVPVSDWDGWCLLTVTQSLVDWPGREGLLWSLCAPRWPLARREMSEVSLFCQRLSGSWIPFHHAPSV